MSFPASNNSADLSALSTCLSETRAQVETMEALRETGDRLFASICRGDTAALAAILEARSAACVRLNDLISTASPAPKDLDQLAVSSQAEVSKIATEILQEIRQIDLLRIKILTTQKDCEEALRAAVADTARQLRQTAGEKKVRSAYNAPSAVTPRYLDSRK